MFGHAGVASGQASSAAIGLCCKRKYDAHVRVMQAKENGRFVSHVASPCVECYPQQIENNHIIIE